jgi:hypothetical protein
MWKFVFGVVSLATLLGFLVGASSSPVAGVGVTAGFGVIAAALAYMQSSSVGGAAPDAGKNADKAARARSLSVATLNSVGQVLTVFSLAFAVGLAVGVCTRKKHDAHHNPIAFPWAGAAAPTDPQDAVDWVLVQQHLRRMGYADGQISEIYGVWLAHKKAGTDPFGGKLLSPLFSQPKDSKADNLIANQPVPKERDLLGS